MTRLQCPCVFGLAAEPCAEGNHRVQVATLDGRFVRSLGSVGSGLGEFVRPRGVVCAPGGLLLVSDQENLRVQVRRPRLVASFVLLCLCSDTRLLGCARSLHLRVQARRPRLIASFVFFW